MLNDILLTFLIHYEKDDFHPITDLKEIQQRDPVECIRNNSLLGAFSIIQRILHCVKSVRIRSYSGPHFPAFGLNTDRVSLRIHSECGKMRTRITPNRDTFHASLDVPPTKSSLIEDEFQMQIFSVNGGSINQRLNQLYVNYEIFTVCIERISNVSSYKVKISCLRDNEVTIVTITINSFEYICFWLIMPKGQFMIDININAGRILPLIFYFTYKIVKHSKNKLITMLCYVM